MKIARIFPNRTNMTPTDPDAYVGLPDLFTQKIYDEIHISVTFTWHLSWAEKLKEAWKPYAPIVKMGGPAVEIEPDDFFEPGKYLKRGKVITSRGCPNRCPFCFVNRPLVELKTIHPGNDILDNNFLACSNSHIEKVFMMLRSQKNVMFTGGLEASRITEKVAENLRSLQVRKLFIAYDRPAQKKPVEKAVQILRKYFKDRQIIRCFVLMGHDGDTIEKATERLVWIYEIGADPFGMLYRNRENRLPDPEWRKFQKRWARPALYKNWMKREGIIEGR